MSTNTTAERCGYCQGTGQVVAYAVDHQRASMEPLGWFRCDYCSGTGIVRGGSVLAACSVAGQHPRQTLAPVVDRVLFIDRPCAFCGGEDHCGAECPEDA
jgi:hypothetical protein